MFSLYVHFTFLYIETNVGNVGRRSFIPLVFLLLYYAQQTIRQSCNLIQDSLRMFAIVIIICMTVNTRLQIHRSNYNKMFFHFFVHKECLRTFF